MVWKIFRNNSANGVRRPGEGLVSAFECTVSLTVFYFPSAWGHYALFLSLEIEQRKGSDKEDRESAEEGEEGRNRDEKGEMSQLCLTLAYLESSCSHQWGGGIVNTPVSGVHHSNSTILYNILCSPRGAFLTASNKETAKPALLGEGFMHQCCAGVTRTGSASQWNPTRHKPASLFHSSLSSVSPLQTTFHWIPLHRTPPSFAFPQDKSYNCIFFSLFCLLIDSHPIMYQLTFQTGALSITLIQFFDFFFPLDFCHVLVPCNFAVTVSCHLW